MFDLNLTPLYFINGQEQPNLPGFYAATAPKRAARGRADEQLVLFLQLQGSAPLLDEGTRQLLERLAQTYFQVPGTVTAALRAIIDNLNGYLLERNLKNTAIGRQAVGLFSVVVLRGTQAYLANCGPVHTFILAPTRVDHFIEPSLAGRGLGLSRVPGVRFFTADIAAGIYLALTPEPPGTWNATTLAGSASLSPETLRRRLLNQSRPDVCIGLVQVLPGSGKVSMPPLVARSRPQAATTATRDEPAVTTATQAVDQPLAGQTTPTSTGAQTYPDADRQSSPTTVSTGETQASTDATPRRSRREELAAYRRPRSDEPRPTRIEQRRAARRDEPPVIEEMRVRKPRVMPGWLAAAWRGWARVRQSAGAFLRKAVARLLPGSADQTPALSTGSMIAIAVIVPLLVVGISLTVYSEKGLEEQYQLFLAQAQAQAIQARSQSDANAERVEWQKVLTSIDSAESRKRATNDSKALRAEAYSNLDQLDGIIRLEYQPALVSDLPAGSSISRILSGSGEIFLLDGAQGSVYRAELTAGGYRLDTGFICGPGPSGSLVVAKIVDIAPLPVNYTPKASLMAIDENGDLLYCIAGEAPLVSLLAVPETNWGTITALAFDGDDLYILDPPNDALWIYGYKDGGYPERPTPFTAENVPSMAGVIDVSINAQDIYLLHDDGHLTVCAMSYVEQVPSRCTDPFAYSDMRPGRDPNPVTFPDTSLAQLLLTDPPDPSIFLLDPLSGSIYHFSMRLNLQRLLRAQTGGAFPLPAAPATAYSVAQNRSVFIAFGNQVFYGYMP